MTSADFSGLKPGDWVLVVQRNPHSVGLRKHWGRAFKLARRDAKGVWTTVDFIEKVRVHRKHWSPQTVLMKRRLGLESNDCELIDRRKYPHNCYKCGAPAFIGIQVDCVNRC